MLGCCRFSGPGHGVGGGVCLSECWGAVGSQALGTEWGGGSVCLSVGVQ